MDASKLIEKVMVKNKERILHEQRRKEERMKKEKDQKIDGLRGKVIEEYLLKQIASFLKDFFSRF
jgi:hypothetical protein